jgi:hypothetical protein
MRCPECTIRNSVAARACKDCGHAFKKKPNPLPLKLAVGGVVGVVALWGAACAIIPTITDPAHSLSRTAKEVAAGPKSPEEALKMRKDLDGAVRTYLKQIGKLPARELTEKLLAELRSTAYEVHTFDLPRGLKLVEVDTVLNACDYLVLNDQSAIKVVPLPGMEVFDGGRVIMESGAPVLVLVGHSAGQAARRPLIQALALLPGDVADETGKAIPGLNCEGTAAFAKNNKDIVVDMSLFSAASGTDLFKSTPNVLARTDDETIQCILRWKNGHYLIEPSLGKGPLSPIMALACTMRKPGGQQMFDSYLGSAGQSFAQANAMPKGKPLQFEVKQLPFNGRNDRLAYFLNGSNGAFQVDLKKADGKWIFWGAKRLTSDQAQIANQQAKTPEFKNTASQPAMIVVAGNSGASPTTVSQAAPVVQKQEPIVVQPAAAVEKSAVGVAPVETAQNDRSSHRHHRRDQQQQVAAQQPAVAENSAVAAAPVETSQNDRSSLRHHRRDQQQIAAQQPAETVKVTETKAGGHDKTHAGTMPAPIAAVAPVRMQLVSTTSGATASSQKSNSTSNQTVANTKFERALAAAKADASASNAVDRNMRGVSKAPTASAAGSQKVKPAAVAQLEFGITTPKQHEKMAAAAGQPQGQASSQTATRVAAAPVPGASQPAQKQSSQPANMKMSVHTPSGAVASQSNQKSNGTAAIGLKTTMTLNPLDTATKPLVAMKPPSVPPIAAPEANHIVDADSVTVRSGHGTEYRNVTEVSRGAKLDVIGKENGWYKVKVNNKEGFVYGGLVDSKKHDAYTTATVKHVEDVKDSKKNHVTTPKAGDKIVVLGGVEDGKYKVQLANGKIGFVNKDAIDVKVDAPAFVP